MDNANSVQKGMAISSIELSYELIYVYFKNEVNLEKMKAFIVPLFGIACNKVDTFVYIKAFKNYLAMRDFKFSVRAFDILYNICIETLETITSELSSSDVFWNLNLEEKKKIVSKLEKGLFNSGPDDAILLGLVRKIRNYHNNWEFL